MHSFLSTLPSANSAHLSLWTGFLLAFSLFTKPEIALAAATPSSGLLLFFKWRSGSGPRMLGSLACGVLAAFAFVIVPLSFTLGSFAQALRHDFLKLYLDCFNPDLTSLAYFSGVSGMDYPLRNTLRLLWGAALASLPFFGARFLLPRLASLFLQLFAALLLVLASAAVGWFAFFSLNSALPLAPSFRALSLSGTASVCPATLPSHLPFPHSPLPSSPKSP